jgi:hypothetical protein
MARPGKLYVTTLHTHTYIPLSLSHTHTRIHFTQTRIYLYLSHTHTPVYTSHTHVYTSISLSHTHLYTPHTHTSTRPDAPRKSKHTTTAPHWKPQLEPWSALPLPSRSRPPRWSHGWHSHRPATDASRHCTAHRLAPERQSLSTAFVTASSRRRRRPTPPLPAPSSATDRTPEHRQPSGVSSPSRYADGEAESRRARALTLLGVEPDDIVTLPFPVRPSLFLCSWA